MEDKILIKDIHQQNLNFLIGSGASFGLFPTLWLPIKTSESSSKKETFESLVTKLENSEHKKHVALMFMYYFKEIIKPAIDFKLENIQQHEDCFLGEELCNECKEVKVIQNYETFIESLVLLLIEKNIFSRRCNLFTTNYDGCIPFTADKLIESGKYDFAVNDGTRGFRKRTMSAKNFNSYICQAGVFGKNASDIPQINAINLHGSVYWQQEDETILVDYARSNAQQVIPTEAESDLANLTAILQDESKSTDDVLGLSIELDDSIIDSFWMEYKKLPIVNPTKWKFHETVFEEHYYQMLRLLSYELEKTNSVLITFGFSFADEHIRNLVKRSLSNPRLQVFICCYNDAERQYMEAQFGRFKNVKYVCNPGGELDFSVFNEKVFNVDFLREEKE